MEGRNVGEDVALAERLREPAPALEVELDLADAVLDGHVQGGEDLAVQAAVRGQAVAALEPLERILGLGVEHGRGGGGRVGSARTLRRRRSGGGRRRRGEIAGRDQASAESRDRRIGLACSQRETRGQRAPATARADLAIAGEDLLERGVLRVAGPQAVEGVSELPRVERHLEDLGEVSLALLAEPVLVDLPRRNASALEMGRELHEGMREPDVGIQHRLHRAALLEEPAAFGRRGASPRDACRSRPDRVRRRPRRAPHHAGRRSRAGAGPRPPTPADSRCFRTNAVPPPTCRRSSRRPRRTAGGAARRALSSSVMRSAGSGLPCVAAVALSAPR